MKINLKMLFNSKIIILLKKYNIIIIIYELELLIIYSLSIYLKFNNNFCYKDLRN